MQFSWSHLHFYKAYMSLLNRMPYVPYVPAWCTYPCVKVPKCEKRANFLFFTYQRAKKRANLPKVCQHAKGKPIFQLCLVKGVPIFQLFLKRIFRFSNFSIMLNICKFQEYLAILGKLISRNKEFKFWHLQNFIKEKPYQPDVVFNGTRGINRTIIWLV